MKSTKIIEDKIIEKIDTILKDFEDFEKAKTNFQGDIIIKRKNSNNNITDRSILTDVFKQMISSDIKKNRV